MKMLDFNAIEKPTWPVKLKDGTTVNLAYPSVELVERMEAMGLEFDSIAKKKDARSIRATFAAVAEAMSCNDDGFTFTAEELRDKYRMTFLDLVVFTHGYLEFIAEAGTAKN